MSTRRFINTDRLVGSLEALGRIGAYTDDTSGLAGRLPPRLHRSTTARAAATWWT